MAQNQYALMEWPTDGGKLSIHHLKHVISPKKSWNEYKPGDTGKSVYPGAAGEWPFIIHAVGDSRKQLASYMQKLIERRTKKGKSTSDQVQKETTLQEDQQQSPSKQSRMKRKKPMRALQPENNDSRPAEETENNSDDEKVDQATIKKAYKSAMDAILTCRGTNNNTVINNKSVPPVPVSNSCNNVTMPSETTTNVTMPSETITNQFNVCNSSVATHLSNVSVETPSVPSANSISTVSTYDLNKNVPSNISEQTFYCPPPSFSFSKTISSLQGMVFLAC